MMKTIGLVEMCNLPHAAIGCSYDEYEEQSNPDLL